MLTISNKAEAFCLIPFSLLLSRSWIKVNYSGKVMHNQGCRFSACQLLGLMALSLGPNDIMAAKISGCHLVQKSIAIFISFDTKTMLSCILHWIDMSYLY
jgi:hypothetical protein